MKINQLSFLENNIKACAFTGHRELPENASLKIIRKTVQALLEKGVHTFYCGMAKGFDLLAAETVLEEKKKGQNVKLVACIPYFGQEKGYSATDKERYRKIIAQADEKITFSDTFQKWKIMERNRFMADSADVLVAYLEKERGGTAYTVAYFQKKYPQREIIFLAF